MQQFFIESIETLSLSEDQIRQCKTVLRMRKGDQVRLVDTLGCGVIAEFTNDALDSLEVIESIEFITKKQEVVLVCALIRSERFEWLLQKATESGVDKIVIWSAQHGVVKDFGSKQSRKMERFKMIVKEAAEQSYRQFVPEIEGIYNYKNLKEHLEGSVFVADLGDHPYIMNAISDESVVNVITGPEGGFSDTERNYFKELGYSSISLGHNVFRAETAGMFICNALSIRGTMNDKTIK